MTTPDTRTPGELTAAPLDSYSPEDRAFFAFWYGHMKDDLMQPPLSSVSYSVARYIWDRALAARPTPASVEALKEEVKRLAGVYTDSARGILAVPSSIDWCAFTDAIDRLAAASTPPAEAQPVAPKATLFHDAGAVAQCGYCKRYTLDRRALSDRQPMCDCGRTYGWSGSFQPPGPDARWFGAPPAVPATEAPAGVLLPIEVVRFLWGEAPLDGVWFGEKHPTERGMYWWRHWIPRASAAPTQEAPDNA